MDTVQIQSWLDTSPFIRMLGIVCTEADAGQGLLAMRMPLSGDLERVQGSGQFHGGAVASLIDTAGDFAVAMGANAPVPTINFRVDFLRPSGTGSLLARARVRRVGKTVGVVDVDVYDEQDRLTAVGRGCFGTTAG